MIIFQQKSTIPIDMKIKLIILKLIVPTMIIIIKTSIGLC